ncbi:MAG: MFS transporter [Dehalococcoidales bacterium]|nr:MFS transporter [Dehalococcoidales bacterium]
MTINKIDRKNIRGVAPNVLFLGIGSLLTDISSEMIFTLVPLFLANVLGAATTVIGFVGGLSDSLDNIFRIFSGWFSDRLGKRKNITVAGYALSTLVKPVMYFASSWGVVLGVRFGDRVGKGIRSSPRDALIADSVSATERGKSFGIHRAMDTLGAVIGLAIAALIIYNVQGSGGFNLAIRSYQWIVIIGVIPAILAVIVLLTTVREPEKHTALNAVKFNRQWLFDFDKRFFIFITIVGLFNLGQSCNFFVILRAQNLEVPLIQTILMLVVYNMVYALISLPAGMLSDKVGRKWVITIGWSVYALVYLGFALATQIWQVWVLFIGYGIYSGVSEGVAKAFVADLVPAEKRGTAYGLYYGVVGLALLPASVLAGYLWQIINPAAAFYFGAAMALVAVIGMIGFIRK